MNSVTLKKTAGFVLIGGALLLPFIGAWKGYLMTPNRTSLPWDFAMHMMAGVKLYQQLTTGDLPSFLYEMLSMGLWLPFHPLLIMLTNLLAPYAVEPAVFLNYLILGAACTGSITLLAGSTLRSRQVLQGSVLFLATAAFLRTLAPSSIWLFALNTIMLEMTGFALTLFFCVAGYLALIRSEMRYYKIAAATLLVILLTKVHYGIWVAIPFLAAMALRQPKDLPSAAKAALQFALSTLRRPYARVLATLALLVLGLLAFRLITGTQKVHWGPIRFSMGRLGNFIWFFLFCPLLIWTVELLKKRNTLFRALPTEWKLLHNICLFPFAWYYLFPFRHKVGTLIYAAGYGSMELTLSERALYYGRVLLNEYWAGMPNITTTGLLFLPIALLIALAFSKKAHRVPVMFLLGAIAFFYFTMSFLNQNKEPRMAITWLAEFFAVFVLTTHELTARLLEKLRPPLSQTIFAVIAASLALLFLLWPHRYSNPETARATTAAMYMEEDPLDIRAVLDLFKVTEPGVIWGTGMNAVSPWIELEIVKKSRWSSSLFKRNKTYVSDLGRKGNERPEEFIRGKVQSGVYRQFVLFRMGFPSNEAFEEYLHSLRDSVPAGMTWTTVLDTPHYTFFRLTPTSPTSAPAG